jgi:hypothetical protein
MKIETKKRHDLFFNIYDFVFNGSKKDTITIDIPMMKLQPLVFAMVKKGVSKEYKNKHNDIVN